MFDSHHVLNMAWSSLEVPPVTLPKTSSQFGATWLLGSLGHTQSHKLRSHNKVAIRGGVGQDDRLHIKSIILLCSFKKYYIQSKDVGHFDIRIYIHHSLSLPLWETANILWLPVQLACVQNETSCSVQWLLFINGDKRKKRKANMLSCHQTMANNVLSKPNF